MSAARPRDCVTARLQVSAPGHDTTSRASSAPASAMPMRGEARVQVGELLLGEAAEREVLPVGDADLDAEVALDLGEARNWSAVMSPRRQYAYALDGAVGPAAHDVGGVPLLQRA